MFVCFLFPHPGSLPHLPPATGRQSLGTSVSSLKCPLFFGAFFLQLGILWTSGRKDLPQLSVALSGALSTPLLYSSRSLACSSVPFLFLPLVLILQLSSTSVPPPTFRFHFCLLSKAKIKGHLSCEAVADSPTGENVFTLWVSTSILVEFFFKLLYHLALFPLYYTHLHKVIFPTICFKTWLLTAWDSLPPTMPHKASVQFILIYLNEWMDGYGECFISKSCWISSCKLG